MLYGEVTLRYHVVTFVLVAAPLAACADLQEPQVPRSEIAVQEELRIGGIDGALEYTFGSVSAVAPAPDGSLYVADRQGPVVRKYDSEGTHLLDVGRAGQGPGEFSSVDGLGVLGDGRLMIYDGRNARLSWFDGNGEFLESTQVSNGLGGFRGFVYSRGGDAYLRVFPESGFTETADGIPADWARVSPDGAVERLVPVPPEERAGPRYVIQGHGGFYRPFTVMTVNALGPDGTLYTVRNDQYRIHRRSSDGDSAEIVRDEAPIRATDEEIAQFEAFSESAASRPGSDRSDYFPIPEVKPFIRELVVDLDGRLWVSRYTEAVFMEYSEWERSDREEKGRASHQWRDLQRWDVFDPEGSYLGAVTFPFKTTFITAEGDQAWGIHGGDYNEAYVVRWSLGVPE